MMINCNTNFKYNQPSFTSRDLTIRRADDLARRINQVFPRISSTNFEDFKNVNNRPEAYNRLADLTAEMRDVVEESMDRCNSALPKIKAFTTQIAESHRGNCGESSDLALIAARINGIETAKKASVYKISDTITDDDIDFVKLKSLDHAVLRVKNGNKPYIIDAWLGFADYLQNAILRYRNEFGYHFDLNQDAKEPIVIPSHDSSIELILNRIPIADLRKAFPELILPEKQNSHNKSQNIFEKIKTHIINFFK